MRPGMYSRSGATAGFTLIELMVTILIGSILLSIAVPAYQSQIRKSRRTEARNAVLDLAGREERYFSTANVYTNDPTLLGYPASGFSSAAPIGSGYYYLTVTATAADPTQAPPVLAGYSIKATTTGTQVKDTACASFTVDQLGRQTAVDSGGTAATTCWN